VSHGGRHGGTLYLEASLYLDETSGTPQWSLRSLGPSWVIATTAPQPARLATTLKTALLQQQKRIWQTNLPKSVKLLVEEEVSGLNRYSEGHAYFTSSPDQFEIRTNYGPELFRRAWQILTLRARILEINDLTGSSD